MKSFLVAIALMGLASSGLAAGLVAEKSKDFRVVIKKEVPCIKGEDNFNALLESLDAKVIMSGMGQPNDHDGISLEFQKFMYPILDPKSNKVLAGFMTIEKLVNRKVPTFCMVHAGVVQKFLAPTWVDKPGFQKNLKKK